MEIDEHIAALESDGAALAGAAARAGLDAAVPSCPGWTVADLLRHTGYVHRWATRNVTECPERVIPGVSEEKILDAEAVPGSRLSAWFVDGHRALVAALRAADPGGSYPVFLPNTTSPLAFWARRQAHETAIHRADAQLAAGQDPDCAPSFAADGIDELIMGFVARSRPGLAAAAGNTMLFHAMDTADAWRVAWPAGAGTPAACERVLPGSADADCLLTGVAGGLYLLLWNRIDVAKSGVTIKGNAEVARARTDGFRVRW